MVFLRCAADQYLLRGGEKGGGVGRREKLERKVGGPTSLKGDFIVIGLNEKRNKSNKRTDVGLAGKSVNQWVEQPKTELPS